MEQPHPSDAPAQPRTQDASPAHPVVHPGERPVRALIAARLSKLQRGGQQGIGIDTQDEKSRAFCEREGMTVVDVVADTKSGTVAPWDRKNLKPWVTEPEKMAMYNAVVAYKTDRWSRGTQEDFTRIEFWATQNGKRLIIVDGPQYPARADKFDSDYWQWQAEKMAARREWELGRERVVRATDALRRENKFVGRIPWGYVTEGPKYDRRLAATDPGTGVHPADLRQGHRREEPGGHLRVAGLAAPVAEARSADRGAGRRAVVADEAGRPDQEPGVPGALLDDPCRT